MVPKSLCRAYADYRTTVLVFSFTDKSTAPPAASRLNKQLAVLKIQGYGATASIIPLYSAAMWHSRYG